MGSRRKHVMVGVAGALALAVLPAGPAAAHEGPGARGNLLKADLVGSQPVGTPSATPVIAGKQPGGIPWVTGEGSRVRVQRDGRIDVRLEGLVVTKGPFAGTNPPAVVNAVATLVCGNAVVDSTAPFPLDRAGNGRTRSVIRVPATCQDPVVLIQPNAAAAPVYIAFTAEDDD